MTYSFIFEPEYSRLINSIFIDNRASIPEIKNKTGFEIKAFIDRQLSSINENTITYKIESELGNLAGFFSIQVNTVSKTAQLLLKELRPAIKDTQISIDLSLQISNFIYNNYWHPDMLFDN
jgi:hypothetical protein